MVCGPEQSREQRHRDDQQEAHASQASETIGQKDLRP
jgi:hypothetical protein